MRSLSVALFCAAIVACAPNPQPVTTAPGNGAVALSIEPNPIVAKLVSGTTYDFPVEVIVRETGGHAVDVREVTVLVRGPGGFPLGAEEWDAEAIRKMGYATTIPANGELRYRFAPRKSVPDDRLFGNVTAELRVDAVDTKGRSTNASTTASITR